VSAVERPEPLTASQATEFAVALLGAATMHGSVTRRGFRLSLVGELYRLEYGHAQVSGTAREVVGHIRTALDAGMVAASVAADLALGDPSRDPDASYNGAVPRLFVPHVVA
jgi:hypothetical protein